MPTYEYKCPDCGHRLILSATITEMEARREFCPLCPAEMRRVFSPPAIRFVGGGWASKS
jgi:putative FmdB family regulatory protein